MNNAVTHDLCHHGNLGKGVRLAPEIVLGLVHLQSQLGSRSKAIEAELSMLRVIVVPGTQKNNWQKQGL